MRRAVDAWIPLYNERRPHQALKFRTPAEVRSLKLSACASFAEAA